VTATNVQGETAVEAWRQGAQLVLEHGEISNLITRIASPTVFDHSWLDELTPRQYDRKYDDISDVVNTIFPWKLASRYPNREQFVAQYLRRHDRGQRWRRNRSAWGTYFERMTRFPGSGGVNQLLRAIDKLSTWPNRSKTGLVFHLSSPAVDSPRTRGGPCWQFGEILWRQGNVLDFVAVYRNQDFFNKALGNFIGLGQLLRFICESSGKQPGALICHSVHAFNGGSVEYLKAMRDLSNV
jgi:hypothetical protein